MPMANRDSNNWKLIAEVAAVTLLAGYFLYSRDISAALAVTIGLLVYSLAWLVKALKTYRRDRDSENNNATAKKLKKNR